MRFNTALAAALLLTGSSSLAFAQSTAKDSVTASEKPGQGTNTGAKKDDKMMAPAPAAGANTGASAGTSGDSKGMTATTPGVNKTGPTKE